MKVLHVITTINRGGAENHLVDLVRGQAARGWQVTVAYLKGDGYWREALEELRVPVRALGLQYYGDIGPLRKLRQLIRQVKPTLVHAHLPPAELYARFALFGLVNPPAFVVSKHNDETFYRGPGAKTIAQWVVKRACRVIVISNAVRRYMVEEVKLPEDLITTIHYGIDLTPYRDNLAEAIASLRASWLPDTTGWLVGTVARLVPQKALHVLLEGYCAYRKRATKTCRLVIVGKGPLEAELRVLAKRLGIETEVIWAGFREDIPVVMGALDVFALTSIYEGFGLVLLEAMATGRPIVASNVSAIPEVVVDGDTGLLVPPASAECIADALRLLEVKSAREVLGHAGFRRVAKHFDLEKMVDNTIDVYKRCIPNSVSPGQTFGKHKS